MKRKIGRRQPVDTRTRTHARARGRSKVGRASVSVEDGDVSVTGEAANSSGRARPRASDRTQELRQAAAAVRLQSLQDKRKWLEARSQKYAQSDAKVARINRILRLMLDNEWNTKVAKAMAVEHQMSLGSIQNEAAEAHRRVLGVTGTDDEVKMHLIQTADRLMALCEAGAMNGDPKFASSAAQLLQWWTGVKGLDAPKEVKLSGAVGFDDIEEVKKAMAENE